RRRRSPQRRTMVRSSTSQRRRRRKLELGIVHRLDELGDRQRAKWGPAGKHARPGLGAGMSRDEGTRDVATDASLARSHAAPGPGLELVGAANAFGAGRIDLPPRHVLAAADD